MKWETKFYSRICCRALFVIVVLIALSWLAVSGINKLLISSCKRAIIEAKESGAELIHEQEVEFVEPNEYSFECKIHGKVEALRYHDGFKMHKYCKRCYGEFLNKHLPAISCPEPNDPDIFTNTLFPTIPDYTEPNAPAKNWHEATVRWPDAQGYITDNFGNTTPLAIADFLVTPAPFMEWELCEPNEPEYTESELDEIYKDEPALGRLAKDLYGYSEPDEPEWHQIQAMIHKDVPPGIYAIWQSPGSEIKPFDITDFIPTWPNYIELEKDLTIESEYEDKHACLKADENGCLYYEPGTRKAEYSFPKGTKVYFK